ncbi:hypothetical protein JCM10450v2_000176 [Rhodotorula kratochvilovae]
MAAAPPATAARRASQDSWERRRLASADAAACSASPPRAPSASSAAPPFPAPYVRRPSQSYTGEPVDFNPLAAPSTSSTAAPSGLPRTSSARDFRSSSALASAFEPRESARRTSEDHTARSAEQRPHHHHHHHPADVRSSSVPTPEPGGSAPATPRAVRGARTGEEETTPTARTRVPSAPAPASASASTSRPLHTPPRLLSQASFASAASPSRASSRSQLADAATGASDDDAHSSSSELAPSSEDDNAWAGGLLPSGSSPPQSPLLAEIVARARHPSLSALAGAGAGGGDRESRPMSEFDWAAAYADSRSPSLMHGFAPHDAPSGAEGVASPPLPPLPVEVEGEEEDAALRVREEGAATEGLGIEAAAGVQEKEAPPPVPPMRSKPSTSQLHAAAVNTPQTRPVSPLPAPPIHPSRAVHTSLPASTTAAPSSSSGFLSPTAVPALLAPAADDRPPSRTSIRSVSSGRRSPGPQPPRPPRRQASNLSLRSGVSDGAPAPPVEPSPPPASAPAPAPAAAAAKESTTPPIPPPASSPPPSAPATAAAEASPIPAIAATPVIPLAVPRLRKPLGGSRRSISNGSVAPSVPEKSARRVSRRLSVLGPLTPSGAEAGEGGAGGSAPGSARGSPAMSEGDAGKRFSVPYSVSDLALAYGRDSWAEYASSESDYPPSLVAGPGGVASARSSHFREPASAEGSPRVAEDADAGAEGEQPHPVTPPRPAPAPAPQTVQAGEEAGRSGTPRGDAKARAAAFIADLKRAKAAAAAGASGTTPLPAARDDPAPPAAVARPASPLAPAAPSADSSPALPSPPRAPSPPPRVFRSGSIFATTARPTLASSPPGTPPPPPPPPNAEKRPSDASGTTLSIRRRSSAAPVPSPAPAPALTPAGPPLLRRRLLPAAIQIAGEIRKARTPRERGRIYAEKMNELARERSRLDEWIAATREARNGVGRSPLIPSSPNMSPRAARQDASTATFAPRADAYKAKELPSHSFSPRDLAPTSAPYPGVLHLGSGRSGGPHSGSSKSSFFSGFGVGRGSLGRRVSKREHHPPSSSSYGAAGSSIAGASTTSLRSTISGPVHLLPAAASSAHSSLSSTTGASVLRPVHGPRMPNSGPSGAKERASLDAHSPSTSPNLAALPGRASFSYGSASMPAHLGLSGGGRYGAEQEEEEDAAGAEADKLARLQDILPQAAREDLVGALARAGGDDVLAISVYLSEQASRH